MRVNTKITKGTKKFILLAALLASITLVAQNPPPTPPQNPPPAQPGQPGQRGGGQGRGRGAVSIMSLTTSAWPDGGQIPLTHSQVGDVSPPLAWANVPEGVTSFVLIVHDADALTGGGASDLLHWMVWNIPGASRALAEGVAQGPELSDGSRQISATGPNYRGPGAPASGPAHHYLFELFALDSVLEVAAVGASPADTRAAVLAAMAGHIRGKATLVGLSKRAVTDAP